MKEASYYGHRNNLKTCQISELQSALDERTQEAKHLNELVIRMEQQPSQDEALKVQIADLKSELATSEGNHLGKYS